MPIYKTQGKKDGLSRYRVKVNYTGADGYAHQIERVAYGLDQAKQLEYKLLREAKGGVISNTLTVRQLYNEYIYSKAHDVRESTLNKAQSILEKHVLPELSDIKVSKLTVPLIQRWKDNINTKGLAPFLVLVDLLEAI